MADMPPTTASREFRWVYQHNLSPVLWIRATYQSYLFGIFPPMFIAASAILCMFALLGAVAIVTPLLHGGAALFGARDTIEQIVSWDSFVSVLASWAVMLAVIALAAAPIGALVRGIYEDRLWALLTGAVLFAAATYGYYWQIEQAGVMRQSPEQAGRFLSVANAASATFFLVGHLICALLLRISRKARLAANVPRFGLSSALLKYFGAQPGRLGQTARIAGAGLGWLLLRGGAVFAGVCEFFYSWPYISDALGLDNVARAAAPVFGAIAASALVAVSDLITRPGLRAYNVVLLLTLAMLAFTTSVALGATIGAGDAEQLRLFSNQAALPLMIALRGWLLSPARDAFARLQSAWVRTAADVVATSARAPVLLLRSFADDDASIPASFGTLAFALGGPRPRLRLEEVISRTLFARGPVIALSNPNAPAPPPLGAARDLVPDSAWQAHVQGHIAGSQLIVCVIGRTPNFNWEIDQIIAAGALRKTIIVASPDYPSGRTISDSCPALAQALDIGSAEDERRYGEGVRVFAYDAKQDRWSGVRTTWGSERAYAEAIRVGAEFARLATR